MKYVVFATLFCIAFALPLDLGPKDIPDHPDCPITPREFPVYIPHDYECESYYECDDNRVARYFQCPPGLHWNEKVNTCDWPRNVNCTKTTTTTTESSSSSTTTEDFESSTADEPESTLIRTRANEWDV